MEFPIARMKRFFLLITFISQLCGAAAFRTQSDSPLDTSPRTFTGISPLENILKPYLSEIVESNGECSQIARFKAIMAKEDITLLSQYVNINVDEALQLTRDKERQVAIQVIREKLEILADDLIHAFHKMETSTCFCCSCLINKLNEDVQNIVDMLDRNFLELKDKTWFKSIVTFCNAAISIVSDMCGNLKGSFPQLKGTEFSPIYTKTNSHLADLLILGSKPCLSQEQKDDVDEVIQLAGNLLNTFSQWLRESEEKAQSDEFKFILEKLANILDKERVFIENKGESMIETGCEKCAELVQFVSEIVNIGETVLKPVLPLLESIPGVEDTIESINEILEQAKDICPYEYVIQGLPATEPLEYSCISTKLASAVDNVRNLAKKLLLSLGDNVSDKVKLPFSNAAPCLSCKDIVSEVDSFLNIVENTMDKVLPEWRNLPFADTIDNFIHEFLSNIDNLCPEATHLLYLGSGCSNVRTDHTLLRLMDATQSMFHSIGILKTIAERKETLNMLSSLEYEVAELSSGLKTVNSCIFCTEIEKVLQKIMASLEELRNLCSSKIFQFLIDFMESEVNGIEGLVDKICHDGNHSSLFLGDRNLGIEENLLTATRKLPFNILSNSKFNLRGADVQVLSQDFSCTDLIAHVKKLVSYLESTLSEIYPDWKSLPILPEVDDYIHSLLDLVDSKCQGQIRSVIELPLVQKVLHSAGEDRHCLNDQEKEELASTISTFKIGFNVVAQVLEVRATMETDPVKKYALNQAVKIIKVASVEVLGNLTIIANEYCGSCTDLVHGSKDLALVIEDSVFDAEPLWRNIPIASSLKEMTASVFDYLDGFCFHARNNNLLATDAGCLTQDQKTTLSSYISTADLILSYAADTLDTAADYLSDGEVKTDLINSAIVLRAVEKDLVQNFTKIADETCGTCQDIFHGLGDLEEAIESALGDINKDWRSIDEYQTVATSVKTIITILQSLCPEESSAEVRKEITFNKAIRIMTATNGLQSGTSTSLKQNSLRESLLLWVFELNYDVQIAYLENEPKFLVLCILSGSKAMQKNLDDVAKRKEDFYQMRQVEVLRDIFHILENKASKLLNIADDVAITCEQIINAVYFTVQEVKQLIEDMVPITKNSDVVNEVVNVLEIFLDVLHDYCVSKV